MAKRRPLIHLAVAVLRVGLGLVFVLAGVVKALEPTSFLMDIHGYRLLPYKLEVATALYLPWLEIVCGLALVVGRWGRTGALAVCTLLMLVFTLALLAGWYRGLDISCGCFGSGAGKTRYGYWLARDLGLLGAIVAVWFLQRRVACPGRPGPTCTDDGRQYL